MTATPLFSTSNYTSGTSASSLSQTVDKPINTSNGDLLVAFVFSQATNATSNTPSGWTKVVGALGRGGGVYYLPVPIASNITETSWTWTFSASGRTLGIIFRIIGVDLNNPVDTFVQGSSTATGTSTIPSMNATLTNELLLGFGSWNNSSATTTVFNVDASMIDAIQLCSPLTGNTSGIGISYQQLSASGATGIKTFTTTPTAVNQANLGVVINPVIVPSYNSSVAFNASGILTASGSQPGSTDASFTSSGSFTASSPQITVENNVSFSGASKFTVHKPGPMDIILRNSPVYVAHRGGSADWPEETLYAYTQASRWAAADVLAMEVSVFRSSDGVWVASHDKNTLRVTGSSYDITTTPWSTLSTLRTIDGNYPLAILDDLLVAFPDRAFFVDNKAAQAMSTFLALLDTHGGPGRFIVKGYGGSSAVASAARNAGYTTWGYYFDADTDILDSTHANWDMLGEDYNAPASTWLKITGYGQPVLAHILPNIASKNAVAQYNPNGYMVSGVQEIVPQTPVIGELSGDNTLSLQSQLAININKVFNSSGLLSTERIPQLSSTVLLNSSGTLGFQTSTVGNSEFSSTSFGVLTAEFSINLENIVELNSNGLLSTESNAEYNSDVIIFSSSGLLTVEQVNVAFDNNLILFGTGSITSIQTIESTEIVLLTGLGTLSGFSLSTNPQENNNIVIVFNSRQYNSFVNKNSQYSGLLNKSRPSNIFRN